jgi:class 3 adenylate cyclase
VNILVAEDNPDSRELLHEILKTMGHEVVLAFDGQDAIEKVGHIPPDLFVLDVDMPRKSGFEVVEWLKQQAHTATVPIILLTARSDMEDRLRGLGLGVEDYLTKPFNPRELMARINARLRAKATNDELREQQALIEKTFSSFVAKEVIDYMLAEPKQIKLGGQLREITVLFADLEGFTSMSEMADPAEILNALNQYHSMIVQIAQSNGGTIDKFLGDGVMVLFNAPIDLEDHVYRAVKTALEIRTALADLHPRLASGFRLGVNFGVNTGPAVVGNIGAPNLMNYTAIGDTVNLAARLQGLSIHNQISISESVYQQIKDRIAAEWVGERSIKGRSGQVNIYRVLDFKTP